MASAAGQMCHFAHPCFKSVWLGKSKSENKWVEERKKNNLSKKLERGRSGSTSERMIDLNHEAESPRTGKTAKSTGRVTSRAHL